MKAHSLGLVEEVAMAMIIEFRGNAVRGEERVGDGKTQGEIIIFPGIRRERLAESEDPPSPQPQLQAEPPKPKRNRVKPKRDRIELPD